ncbi:glycosyltransferase family 2 protein [Salinisphaera aquimarina]|uniref:Glycosyltransferase family 2 protein n=1 Tax=Salinisphaera aquimarina TaxID=2094031 RepID=A0ABV7ETN9_9GAMM
MTVDGATSVPRVTVCIPAYNASAYIGEAIESVLAQAYRDFELLVIDDCSVDDTVAICRQIGDERLRLIERDTNGGRPAVRNQGLAEARGEFLALLDADDRCLPDRLAQQVAFLDAHPQVDVLGSWWHTIDAHGNRLPAKKNHRRLSPDMVACYLLYRGVIHNPTVMARRAAMAGYAYDPEYSVAEDYDLWDRMRPAHGMAVLPARLIEYRSHDAQASTARVAESHARRQQIQARQLDALGMCFDARDVLFHHLLYTGRRMFEAQTGAYLDCAYVDWAADWLTRLVAANAERRCYPEPAFTRLAAQMWINVCRKAAKRVGPSVWLRCVGLPLARALPGAWWAERRHGNVP